METTLILVKPDGVRRGLVGEIIKRFEQKGLAIRGLKMLRMTDAMAEAHYAEHVTKPFFPELKAFITSGPMVALAVSGPDAIALSRGLMGKTKAVEAAPGTIRGDYATITTENLVHGSDGPESAARELAIYFKPEELVG
ncbi:MAG: nucleoside-diphosphate kinase [Candidatus Sumerlaeia bacterium]|nr:nucleoside-diphosphate kinase [Candidatus Sumerlaeia bacterium]